MVYGTASEAGEIGKNEKVMGEAYELGKRLGNVQATIEK